MSECPINLKQCETFCNEKQVMPAMRYFVEEMNLPVNTAAREVSRLTRGLVTRQRARDVWRNRMERVGKHPSQPEKGENIEQLQGDATESYSVEEAAKEVLGEIKSHFNAEKNQIKKEKKKQKEIKKKTLPDDLPATNELYELFCDDFRSVELNIKVDFIITDPPYKKEFIPLYKDLSIFASEILKPNGSLIVMAGQSYLPEVLNLMTENINYQWMLAYLTPGGQSVQLFQRRVNTFWKPLLWFVNGQYEGDWIGDVTSSNVNDNDKIYHKWGQSESGMADIIERFTYPGQVILDPFMGGGTTGTVAIKLNRKFIGIEKEVDVFNVAKSRFREIS